MSMENIFLLKKLNNVKLCTDREQGKSRQAAGVERRKDVDCSESC